MRTPDPDNVYRGYIQSWNASIERRLPFDMSINAAYVGTKTTRGFANVELNVSPPGGGEQGRVFFAEFQRTASTTQFGGWNRAMYHAMQLQLSRPFKNNLLVRVVLRDLERTLTAAEANLLRDRIYAAIHRGSAHQSAADRG